MHYIYSRKPAKSVTARPPQLDPEAALGGSNGSWDTPTCCKKKQPRSDACGHMRSSEPPRAASGSTCGYLAVTLCNVFWRQKVIFSGSTIMSACMSTSSKSPHSFCSVPGAFLSVLKTTLAESGEFNLARFDRSFKNSLYSQLVKNDKSLSRLFLKIPWTI